MVRLLQLGLAGLVAKKAGADAVAQTAVAGLVTGALGGAEILGLLTGAAGGAIVGVVAGAAAQTEVMLRVVTPICCQQCSTPVAGVIAKPPYPKT